MSAQRARGLMVVAALAVLACPGLWGRAPRVLLIGLDGVDPDILERLMEGGRLPHLSRLRHEGSYSRLLSREPLLSPLLWTSIATGRKPQDHGVLDFVEVSGAGRVVPITGRSRRVPALWNIASEFERTSGFVGWYGSFPAEPVRGFVVSDRLGYHQVKSARAEAAATFPDGLASELAAEPGLPAPDLARTRRALLNRPYVDPPEDGRRRVLQLARLAATAEFYGSVAPKLQRRFGTELLGVYFELIDACSHLFMEDAPPRRGEVEDDDYRAFSGTVDRCYEYQDQLLGDLLAIRGAHTVTLVLSDHGFKSGDLRPRISGRADTGLAPLWHRVEGVLIVAGPEARRGVKSESASILDIAPTVLSLLRIPPSPELPGRPLAELFADGALATSLRPVAAYAPAPLPPVPVGDDSADERVERLRALGYLSGGPRPAHDESGRTATSFLNEGYARAQDGDAKGALAAYARALGLDPGNVNARAFMARLKALSGERAEAGRLLEEALRLDPRHVFARLQRAALALDEGLLDAAAADLRAAESIDDRLPLGHFLQARLEDARARPAQALAELETARRLGDSWGLLAEVALLRAQILAEGGRAEEAQAALALAERLQPALDVTVVRGQVLAASGDAEGAAKALALAAGKRPGDVATQRHYARALAAAGRPQDAEALLRSTLEAKASPAALEGAYGELAKLLDGQGRASEVLDLLNEATRRFPRSAALWAMRGAAHGRLRQYRASIAAYRRSVELGPTALTCKTLAALLYFERRDREGARELWQRSLELDPDQPDVRAALQRAAGGAQTSVR